MRKGANGAGSIYRRKSDGKWVGAVSIGEVSGKPLRRTIYGDTEREVVNKITKIRDEHRRGLPVAAGDNETVADFLDRWIEHTAPISTSPRTWAGYSEIVRTHLVPGIGKVKLTALQVEHVEALFAAKRKAELSTSTVRNIRAVLRIALNEAMRRNLIGRNVAALARIPMVETKEIVPLTRDEAKRLIASIKGHKLELPFLIALLLGLRRGEVLGLGWDAVDVDAGILNVRQQLQRVSRKMCEAKGFKVIAWLPCDAHALRPLKSKQSKRKLGMPSLIVERMKAHKANQAAARLAAGPKWTNPHGLLFVDDVGAPMLPDAMTHAWGRALKVAKIPARRLHDARHTAGSLLLEEGVDLKVISAWLGHSTVTLTANTYLHTRDVAQRDVVEKLDRMYAASV